MSFRIRSVYPWLWVLVLAALSAGSVSAQPLSPLELVRGLRENGQVDLAIEYLKEIEGKLSPDDKAALLLERAKCLLDASEDEPDEGTRLGMIAEAKEGLSTFVFTYPNHPRAIEGLLTTAKLTSLDAKEILSRARKMDIPAASDDNDERRAREQAQKKQYAEASKARPLFQLASKRFADASERLRTQLEDKTLPYNVRRNLEREAFEADLASGINQFSIAETFMPDDVLAVAEKKLRSDFLEQAKEVFLKLGKGPSSNRTVWVARAWFAEVTYEQQDFAAAAAEVATVLRASALESEDGKRLARFFQLRRNARAALNANDKKKIDDSVKEMRGWLALFGNQRKPTPEVYAVKYYLARILHFQADALTIPPKPPAVLVIGATALAMLNEAEKIYRGLAQSDHEYTARAARFRMAAVRKLLGDADQNPLVYATFEKAQMASLIQLGKLFAAEAKEAKLAADEKPDDKKIEAAKAAKAEAQVARGRVIGLLERARELATPQDHGPDVIDVQLRLIFFYQQNDQFYQAAVLGDFVSRTIKSTGGKAALAGLLGVNGYVTASRAVKTEDRAEAAAARQADRDRAVALARFLDVKYPNDNATDSARHRLAELLVEEERFMEAFDVLVKLRPSYTQLTRARLLEGFVVGKLVIPLDSSLPPGRKPLSKEDKARLFRRAASDLAKVPKPASIASEDEVRDYLSARSRLAQMMFAQERADPETEARDAGFNQALGLAEKILPEVAAFDCMVDDKKKLNLDGQEMYNLALDTYTRALYLRARAMTNNNQFEGALALIQPVLDQVQANGPLMTKELIEWSGGAGSEDPEVKQKARIAQLAAGVDKNRVDVILAGFRVQVRQGKSDEAAKLLDLLVKAGGTIEESLPLLEPVGRELAALMVTRQKEGKLDEAKNLSAGLAVLLNKIRSVKTLSVTSLLFIGQTLQNVGKNAEAVETLKNIPAPAFPGWEKLKPEPLDPDRTKLVNRIRDAAVDVLFEAVLETYGRGKGLNQVLYYALAKYSTAKAHIELKQFAEAEKLLTDIVGTSEKPGWGSSRLYFRKALADVYEGKGAELAPAMANPDKAAAAKAGKDAQLEWGKAFREWTTLYNMNRSAVAKLVPPKDATPEQLAQLAQATVQAKNGFADAFFDVQRCLVTSNQQLLKFATPDKLQKKYDDAGKSIVDIEKQLPPADWQPEVQNRYYEFLKATPPVLAAYKNGGGKLFLEKMPARP